MPVGALVSYNVFLALDHVEPIPREGLYVDGITVKHVFQNSFCKHLGLALIVFFQENP